MSKPEKIFKAGSVKAAIFSNTIKKKDQQINIRSVKLTRAYKNKEGKWENTTSLNTNDIPKATLVLNKAYEYLQIQPQDEH